MDGSSRRVQTRARVDTRVDGASVSGGRIAIAMPANVSPWSVA